MRYWFAVVISVCVACGGRLSDDGGVDGGAAHAHGALCTQSSCASLVRTIASVPLGAGEQLSPPGLFVGGGFIYTSTPTHLVRAPVGGGALENVAPSSLTWAILADDANVYWSTPTQVLRMAHAGGVPDVVATTTGADIFLDATRLYWTTGVALESVPIAGGEPMTVDVPTFEPGVLAAGRLFESDCSSVELQAPGVIVAGYDVVANSSHCYIRHGTFCSPSSGCGDLVSIPIGGGAMTVVAQGETAGEATAFDGQRMMLDENGVYLRRADSSTGTLIRVPFDGGAIVDVTTDLALAYEVAAETIYWASLGNDGLQLKSMPKYKP